MEIFLPLDGIITLTNNDTSYELPSPAILEAHAAVARILNATGMGEKIEDTLRDREELRCLATDGSTDVHSLLLVF